MGRSRLEFQRFKRRTSHRELRGDRPSIILDADFPLGIFFLLIIFPSVGTSLEREKQKVMEAEIACGLEFSKSAEIPSLAVISGLYRNLFFPLLCSVKLFRSPPPPANNHGPAEIYSMDA